MGVNFLIVVSILEGRNFPHRQDRNLTVEAKFDGVVMYTDPVPHDKTPSFNTELAWEVDRKGLQLHRLQRSPIKVQCYAVDSVSSQKEAIGYLVLDIRLAHEKLQPAKWYPLLNSKYNKQRPDILIALHLEKDEQRQSAEDDEQSTSNGAKKKQHLTKSPARSQTTLEPITTVSNPEKNVDTSELKPKLNVENGIYYIGPPEHCSKKFTFSITIAFAANLTPLAQLHSLPSPIPNFYFYYSLFGNDVTTEYFQNFENPDFPAERASVKIFSNISILKSFFSQQPNLPIFFCCGDVSAGVAEIPISQILNDSSDIENQPASIEGTFEIHSIMENKAAYECDPYPQVGICVMLKKLDEEENTPNKEQEEVLNQANDDVSSTSASEISKHMSQTHTEGTSSGQPDINKTKMQLEHRNSPPQKLSKADENEKKATDNPVLQLKSDTFASNVVPRVSFVDNIATRVLKNATNIDITSQSLPVPHHFCFTIDLRTLRTTQQSSYLNCFLRYCYPFFGSTVPILTHPCIEVRPGTDTTLPRGYCAFNFATLHHQLESTFREFPLVIELIHRDKQGHQRDRVVGSAKVQLNAVLGESPTTFARENGVIGMRQISTCAVPILTEDRKQIAELLIVMSLDDLGPTNIPVILAEQTSLNTQLSNTTHAPQFRCDPSVISRTRVEQRTKEFEDWKEQQELMFKDKMKEKELHHIQTLTMEWKKRDMERELLMQRKIQEYQQLEDKLKQALSDIEVRERHLVSSENEIKRQKADMKHQQEQIQRETKEIIQRVKGECDFMSEMERNKVQEFQEKYKKAQEQVRNLEKKVNDKESIIESLKEERDGSVETHLQADIKVLTNEKADLLKKVENAVAAKQRYKQQWGQALRKIAQLEQKVLDLEKNAWMKKEEEYEMLHLSKLASTEQGNLQQEKEALSMLKDKVTAFTENTKPVVENHGQHSKSITTGPTTSTTNISTETNASSDMRPQDFLQRLIEERNTLLSTGVYPEEDKIIVELNEHIQKAMNLNQ